MCKTKLFTRKCPKFSQKDAKSDPKIPNFISKCLKQIHIVHIYLQKHQYIDINRFWGDFHRMFSNCVLSPVSHTLAVKPCSALLITPAALSGIIFFYLKANMLTQILQKKVGNNNVPFKHNHFKSSPQIILLSF